MKKLYNIKVQIMLGAVLIVIGLGLFSLRLLVSQTGTVPVPHKQIVWQSATPAVITGNPVHLDLPSLKLSLTIINGYYDVKTKEWTLSLDKVQYATLTPPPNDAGGNTFLYGHYRWGVFATLHRLPANSEAIVTTDNGHTFTYRFASSRVTTPQDDSLFYYTGKPILTIQTCTGLFFRDRQLFTFTLEKVS